MRGYTTVTIKLIQQVIVNVTKGTSRVDKRYDCMGMGMTIPFHVNELVLSNSHQKH